MTVRLLLSSWKFGVICLKDFCSNSPTCPHSIVWRDCEESGVPWSEGHQMVLSWIDYFTVISIVHIVSEVGQISHTTGTKKGVREWSCDKFFVSPNSSLNGQPHLSYLSSITQANKFTLSEQTLYSHGLFCDMNRFKVSPVCISGNRPLLYGYQLMRVLKNSEIRGSQGHVLHITAHAQIVICYSALSCTLVAAFRFPFLSAMHCYSYCMYCIPCCSLFLTSVF